MTTHITGFSVYPQSDMTEEVFDPAADTFIAEIAQFVTEANTQADENNANATAAAASAAAAESSATDAQGYAASAQGYRDTAQTHANNASASATSAVNAPGTNGTSTTSLTVGTGSKTLTTQAGKAWVVGQPVMIARTAAPSTTWMAGVITAYNSGTGSLTVNVATSYTAGSGTFSDWTISLTAPQPATWPWATLTGTPTTKAGYGITDVPSFAQATYNFMSMQAASPTLPDLTLGWASVAVTAPSNASAVPATLLTSDGWSITTGFVAGTLRTIAAVSYATPHGTWASCPMTPPSIGSFSAAGTPTVLGSAQLDTNLFVMIYKVSSTVYAVAYNASTHTFGTPQALSGSVAGNAMATVHAVSTTSFVVAFAISSDLTVQAGSVNTGTLAITLGSAVTNAAAGALLECALQLSATLYVALINTGSSPSVIAYSVSGTTVTLGAAVSAASTTAGLGAAKIAKCSATQFVLAAYGTGGGTSSTRALTARVGSISGTTISLGTLVTGAENTFTQGNGVGLVSITDAATYVFVESSSTSASTATAVTVSAGAVSAIGSKASITQSLSNTSGTYQAWDVKQTYVCKPPCQLMKYNGTTLLMGSVNGSGGTTTGAGYTAMTVSGSTITVGSTVSRNQSMQIMADPASAQFFGVGTADTDLISVSGATASNAGTFTGAVMAFAASSGFVDKAAKYFGGWFSMTPGPTYDCAFGTQAWVGHSGSTVTAYGPIT